MPVSIPSQITGDCKSVHIMITRPKACKLVVIIMKGLAELAILRIFFTKLKYPTFDGKIRACAGTHFTPGDLK